MPASPTFSYPHLLADLGGTNARFAVVERPGAAMSAVLRLATQNYAEPAAAFAAACRHFQTTPGTVLIAGAGPRFGSHLPLTNAAWTLDIAALAAPWGGRGALFNDFEALALALPFLPASLLAPIGPFAPQPGPRLAIGPGTGLGVAALIEAGGRFIPLASEAAHMGFGPLSRAEERLFKQVERVEGRLTAEVLLSGRGLERLFAAQTVLADGASEPIDSAHITAQALAQPDSVAAETVRVFLMLLARFAGDLAIAFRAEGGVFIGGGIVPRLLPLLDPQAFRLNFAAKAPVSELAQNCPTAVITGEGALIGLAAYGANPERFTITGEGRLV